MSVKVNLVQGDLADGYNEIVEMDAIPREGESICFDINDSNVMIVKRVIWVIDHPDYQVMIRFR